MQRRDEPGGPHTSGPLPSRIFDLRTLSLELELLRTRAARGTSRQRVSLQTLTRATNIPRSTLHAYLRGARIPPADSLDTIVQALGATRSELREWAEALYRVVASSEAARRAPGLPVTQSDPRSVEVPRQLPAAPRRLIGREADIAELDLSLGSHAPSVVILTGVGGIGKTALALHWARSHTESFPDGQIWLDLQGFGPMEPLAALDSIDRLLSALGVDTTGMVADVSARATAFRSAASKRRLLIVLDNARDATQVLPLIAGDPSVHTIITSRNELHALTTGVSAARIRVEEVSLDAALEILTEDQHSATARGLIEARVAELCSGLPLALQIVRERLSGASRGEIDRLAAQLRGDRDDRLAALDLKDQSAVISVRSALLWSYAALPADAQQIFRRLPLCLTSTFTLASAAAVGGVEYQAAQHLLDRLVSANLLDAVDQDRYRLHDLVTLVALECLDGEDPAHLRAARLRLVEHLAARTESFVNSLDMRPLRLPMKRRRGTHGEVEASVPDSAWMRAAAQQLQAVVMDAAGRPELTMYCSPLAERAARALWPVTDVRFFESALLAAREGADARGDVRGSVVMSRHLGLAYGRRGDLRSAQAAFAAAVHTAHRDPGAAIEVGGPVSDISNLGAVWLLQGRVRQAAELLAEVAPTVLAGDDVSGCLLTLTDLELQRGRPEPAAEYLRSGTDHAIRHNYLHGAVALEALLLSGRLHRATGDPCAALTDALAVERRSRLNGHREYLSQSLALAAHSAVDCEEIARARELGRRALSAARVLGGRGEEAAALDVLARVALASGDPTTARALVQSAVKCARSGRIRYTEALALLHLAQAQAQCGDRAASREAAELCMRIAKPRDYSTLVRAARSVISNPEGPHLELLLA